MRPATATVSLADVLVLRHVAQPCHAAALVVPVLAALATDRSLPGDAGHDEDFDSLRRAQHSLVS